MSQATAMPKAGRRKCRRAIPVTDKQFEAIEALQDRTPGLWERGNEEWMAGMREILGEAVDAGRDIKHVTIEVS